MSFRFNREAFEDNSFNEQIRDALTSALNSKTRGASQTHAGNAANSAATDEVKQETKGPKRLDILKSGITVSKVNFPSIPQLEILDLDVSAQSKSLLKGICKVSCKNAMLEINTEIEANLLLLYTNDGPSFTTPRLIANDSFTVPITMTFNQIELEAITNIFVKNNSVGISFNDVNLDFDFNCSIKLLQSSIEKRLKGSMETVFKDVLPSVIFSMSQRWFTHGELTSNHTTDDASSGRSVETHPHIPKTILDDCDLEVVSPANMLRLSTLVSSRQSLSLNSTAVNALSTIPGCLERQNLHRFNSRIPALSNFYPTDYENEVPDLKMLGRSSSSANTIVGGGYAQHHNALPQKVLDEQSYSLRTIASVQSRIYERRSGDSTTLRRRKIRIARKTTTKPPVSHATSSEDVPSVQAATSENLAQAPDVQTNVTPEPLQHPLPVSVAHSPQLLAEKCAFTKIPALTLPNQIERSSPPAKPPTQKLNVLEEAHNLSRKRDLQKLRSS